MDRTMFVLLIVIILYGILVVINFSYTLSINKFSFELSNHNESKIYEYKIDNIREDNKIMNVELMDLI